MQGFKEIIEEYIDANGISRAEVMTKMGKRPQAWSKLVQDAKWPVAVMVCHIIGFDLERALYDMLNGRPHTETFVKCPNCGKTWEITIKTE